MSHELPANLVRPNEQRLDRVVQSALKARVNCKHLEDWPEPGMIAAGVIACPYCEVQGYRDNLDAHREAYDRLKQELATAMQRADKLNATNTALQRLAIDFCQTPEQIAELSRINRAQYEQLSNA